MYLAVAIRGLASMLLAAAALAAPEPGLELLVRLIGGYAVLVGLVAISAAVWSDHDYGSLTQGVVDLGLGVGVFVWPGASAIALLWPVAVALWAVLAGIAEFIAARPFRNRSVSWLLLRASGMITVAFGVLLAVVALPGTQPIVWLVAAFAAATGALKLGAAISLVRPRTPRDQPTG